MIQIKLNDGRTIEVTPEEQEKARTAWVDDLMSSPPQIKGLLESTDGNCCLGRACRVVEKMYPGAISITPSHNGSYVFFDGGSVALPRPVQDILGLSDQYGGYGGGSLVSMNDTGKSFKEIAEVIKSRRKGLFVN